MLASVCVAHKLHSRLRAEYSLTRALRANPRVQADVLEAYIGGVHREQGYHVIRHWLRPVFRPLLEDAYLSVRQDFQLRTRLAAEPFVRLHEHLQKSRVHHQLAYEQEGAPPNVLFRCTMEVRDLRAVGQGRSKLAARNA